MVLGGTAIKPKERKGWEAVQYLIYNKETGEVFTRTPKSWALIFVFYVIYYCCLAAFWAAMLTVFFTTLPEGMPKWQGAENGIIGQSPGVGLRPVQHPDTIASSMITYSQSTAKDSEDGEVTGYQGWVNRTDDFLAPYKLANTTFEMSKLGACNTAGYGYAEGKPCIFLKLNKIYGLVHDYFNNTDHLPDDFPANLKTVIENQSDKNQVWINCRPEYPADKEGIKSMKYYPESQGFPASYFPYLNDPGYLSPLVAVQIEPMRKGQLLHLECRAFAHNILYSRRDRIGMVHLEIYLRE